jgi:DNA-binding NarL/FixJ family response regulator
MYRAGLRAQIEVDPGVVVVDEFATAHDAVAAILELRPDVSFMDLRIPRRKGEDATYCGADAIGTIRQSWPEAVIVVLTTYSEDERVREALHAGARGYLLKQDESTDFVQQLRLVAEGKGVFDRRIVDRLPFLVAAHSNGRRPFRELSPRENDVIEEVALGKGNDEVARVLGIRKKTVENMLPRIFAKLQVNNRQDAISRARAEGLGGEQFGSKSPENRDNRT